MDAYDAAGRVIAATDPLSGTTAYGYAAAGNTVAITTSSVGASSPVQVEVRGYDALNDVITDTLSAPGSTPSTTLTTYHSDRYPVQQVQPNGDVTFDTYDLADRCSMRRSIRRWS